MRNARVECATETPTTTSPGQVTSSSHDSCAKVNENCVYRMWTVDGVECHFPFRRNKRYNYECVRGKRRNRNRFYCKTVDGKEGECDFSTEQPCGCDEQSTLSPSPTTILTSTSADADCVEKRRTTSGEDCAFPFEYLGATYTHECVGDIWCFTDSFSGSYGYCDMSKPLCNVGTPVGSSAAETTKWATTTPLECVCERVTTDGQKCAFPFNYQGVTYTRECAENSWCFVDDHDWAYCDMSRPLCYHDSCTAPTPVLPVQTSTGQCVSRVWTTGGKECQFPFEHNGQQMFECVKNQNRRGQVKYWCMIGDGRKKKCDMTSRQECDVTAGTTSEPEHCVRSRVDVVRPGVRLPVSIQRSDVHEGVRRHLRRLVLHLS